MNPNWNKIKTKVSDGKATWLLKTNEPLLIRPVYGAFDVLVIPGDNIAISYNENGRSYDSKGSASLQLQAELEEQHHKILKPEISYTNINSVEDYLRWKKYFDNRLEAVAGILNSYQAKMPAYAFDWIKMHAICRIEGERTETFMVLNNFRIKNSSSGIKASDMVAICDSTLNGYWANWLNSLSDYKGNTWYFFQYNRIQVWKQFGFEFTSDKIKTDFNRRILYYNSIKKNYKGLTRERILQYVIANETIKEIGFKNAVTKFILNDYYSQSDFPEYKQWMKKYEDSVRRARNELDLK